MVDEFVPVAFPVSVVMELVVSFELDLADQLGKKIKNFNPTLN